MQFVVVLISLAKRALFFSEQNSFVFSTELRYFKRFFYHFDTFKLNSPQISLTLNVNHLFLSEKYLFDILLVLSTGVNVKKT